MRIDPADLSPAKRYFLMTSCILPRPIAWVGTVNDDGGYNLGAFSFFNGFSSTPPVLGIGFGPHPEKVEKDTLRNIRRTGELTVSIPAAEHVVAVDTCGDDLPYGESEFAAAGLTPVPGETVAAPRIAEAGITFECRLYQVLPLGGLGSTLVLAEVKAFFIADGLLDERGAVAPDRFTALARMAAGRYSDTGPTYKPDRG